MIMKDLQSEAAFYGKDSDYIGHLYMRPETMSVAYPDILFLSLYTLRLLTDKKVSLKTAQSVQAKFALGKGLLKAASWAEDRPFSFPARVIEYKGFKKDAFSASMMVDRCVRFRFGRLGFGFFSSAKHYDDCAEKAIYGMLETVYEKTKKDPEALNNLWKATAAIGALCLGTDVNKGNFQKVAEKIYSDATGDDLEKLGK